MFNRSRDDYVLPWEYSKIYREPDFLADLAPRPPPSPHLPSASCRSFSIFLCVVGRGGREWGGAKSYREKAWSSINHSILPGLVWGLHLALTEENMRIAFSTDRGEYEDCIQHWQRRLWGLHLSLTEENMRIAFSTAENIRIAFCKDRRIWGLHLSLTVENMRIAFSTDRGEYEDCI